MMNFRFNSQRSYRQQNIKTSVLKVLPEVKRKPDFQHRSTSFHWINSCISGKILASWSSTVKYDRISNIFQYMKNLCNFCLNAIHCWPPIYTSSLKNGKFKILMRWKCCLGMPSNVIRLRNSRVTIVTWWPDAKLF